MAGRQRGSSLFIHYDRNERAVCGGTSLNLTVNPSFVTCLKCVAHPIVVHQAEAQRLNRRPAQQGTSSLPPHLRTEVPSYK